MTMTGSVSRHSQMSLGKGWRTGGKNHPRLRTVRLRKRGAREPSSEWTYGGQTDERSTCALDPSVGLGPLAEQQEALATIPQPMGFSRQEYTSRSPCPRGVCWDRGHLLRAQAGGWTHGAPVSLGVERQRGTDQSGRGGGRGCVLLGRSMSLGWGWTTMTVRMSVAGRIF